MMETASDTVDGPECDIGARAAETAADQDHCDGDVHCGNAQKVVEADDPDIGGDGDVRSDDAYTEKVASNQNSSSDGGAYAAEVAACTVGGVGGEPGIDAHTTEAAADPASDTDGDVRGGDCPAGPDDSDAAVSDYSYTTINNYLIVGSVSEILMSHSSGTAASSNLVYDMAANGLATAVDSDAVADGVVDGCDSDITTGGTVVKAVSSDSKAVSVGVSVVTWSEAACRCGSAAAPGPVRADSEEISSRMAKSHEMHIIDDAFAAVAIFQILLVGLYCLPLVLPDRVSIMKLFVHPSVMKLASWENLFIEPVHRWRAGRTCSLFLHYIKPFYDRFDLFHNWLLAWRSEGELRVRDPRSASLSSDVGMTTHEPTGSLGGGDNCGHAYPSLSKLSLTVRKSSGRVMFLILPGICSCRDVCTAAGALAPYHCLWYDGRLVPQSDEPFQQLPQQGDLLLELMTSR